MKGKIIIVKELKDEKNFFAYYFDLTGSRGVLSLD